MKSPLQGGAVTKKNVIITGANRGIGLELTRKYAERGDVVTACCRTLSQELKEISEIQIIEGVDVTIPSTLDGVKDALKDRRIDILVNNAGILKVDTLESFDPEDLRRQYEVNSLGPLLVTRALLTHLTTPGAKVAMVTSRMGSIDDNQSGGYYGYRMSKTALNIGSVSLARDLYSKGIAVVLLHPGYVATDMTNHRGTIDTHTSATGLIKCIDQLTLENSGTFLRFSGEELPW